MKIYIKNESKNKIVNKLKEKIININQNFFLFFFFFSIEVYYQSK
jgi:hypothetical protein